MILKRLTKTKGTLNFDKFEASYMKSRKDLENLSELKYLINVYSTNSPENIRKTGNSHFRNSSLYGNGINEITNDVTKTTEL